MSKVINRNRVHGIEQTIALANDVKHISQVYGLSERGLATHFGISKSEIHRLIVISQLDKAMLKASVKHGTEKYVLLDWAELAPGALKDQIEIAILSGAITRRRQLKETLAASNYKRPNANYRLAIKRKIERLESEIQQLKIKEKQLARVSA